MFRLPVCPHCGTVYHYQDTRKAIRNKENTCYHCQKKFRARMFPFILIGASLPLVICIAVNIFLLTRMKSLQLLPLFAVTLAAILIIYLIVPFFTKFRKLQQTDQKQENNQEK